MGKRIGKYKVDGRTSEQSIVDGGSIEGSLNGVDVLDVAGDTTLSSTVAIAGTTTFTGGQEVTGVKRPVVALTDLEAASAHTTLTTEQSGAIILVPALSSGTQTIQLPAAANALGCYYTFVVVGATATQDFDVTTNGSEKIIGCTPDGDGTQQLSADHDSAGFDSNAPIGSRFTITCISTTAATAFLVHDILDGLAANTAGFNLK